MHVNLVTPQSSTVCQIYCKVLFMFLSTSGSACLTLCTCFVFLQPLHKGLDPANLEQLITPLTTLGHLAQLAPEQFAAPLKSLVANFIVKDLLMNDRVHTSYTYIRIIYTRLVLSTRSPFVI